MTETEIGIIGFGRFGRLLVKCLSEDFKVYAFDKENKRQEIKEAGATPASLEEVSEKDIIIPSVPISEFENVLNEIKMLVREGSLVVDVCSVKEHPARVMRNILPKHVQILATHPLFGPDSAPDTLEGQKIVLCRERIADSLYEKVKSFLSKKGLIIIETTPKKHDEEIVKSLVLPHFIGRCFIDMGLIDLEIDTECYRRLMKILEVVKNDKWQLFEDMNRYNRFSRGIREKFMESLHKLDSELKEKGAE